MSLTFIPWLDSQKFPAIIGRDIGLLGRLLLLPLARSARRVDATRVVVEVHFQLQIVFWQGGSCIREEKDVKSKGFSQSELR